MIAETPTVEEDKKNKKLIFILTNLSYQSIMSFYASYAITKSSMADLFNYDSKILGRYLLNKEPWN